MAESAPSAGGVRRDGYLGFAIQVVRGRWFSLFASFLIMAGAGATYLFGTYSPEIKATLGYDQTTLNLMGFFKDLGANVGVLSGLIAEVTPTWFVLLIGAAMNFVGYFMIWMAVTGRIPRPRVWQMCLYICIGANSQNFANTGALVTSVMNFPESRGIMLGLLKGYVGLSGAILTQIYLAVYGNDSKSLILLIAWLPASLSLIFVYTIRKMEVRRQTAAELKLFFQILYVSVAMALFILVITVVQKVVKFSKAGYAISVTVVCGLLLYPLIIAITEESKIWNQKSEESSTPPQIAVETPPAAEKSEKSGGTPWYADIFKKPNRGEDYTILQALTSADMLILFFASFCGLGSSLTAVDNLGQIGQSLGYPKKTISTFLSILSIWNFFGRIFSGFVSESLLAKYQVPRPLMLSVVLGISCLGLLLVATPFPGSLYFASVIIGFSFGAQLPLLFAIISELFGLKYYATLFNCGQIASPLGSYVFNVRIAGRLYDQEAMKQLAAKGLARSAVKELTCLGKTCYRLPFIILTVATLVGSLSSLVLVARTRKFYSGDIYKQFKERNDSETTTPAVEIPALK